MTIFWKKLKSQAMGQGQLLQKGPPHGGLLALAKRSMSVFSPSVLQAWSQRVLFNLPMQKLTGSGKSN
jgi:hypothetical protein